MLLVVVAFLVAQAVVKSGLGRRISLFMVSRFGRSSLGLAYSIVLTDAVIAPAFPSNTARGGVLFPVVLAVAQGAGSRPDDPKARRLGGYLMFCGDGEPRRFVRAVDDRDLGESDRVQMARDFGLDIGFGKWLVAASVPALAAILLLPLRRRVALSARACARRPTRRRPHAPRWAKWGRCRATSGSWPWHSR